MKGKASWILYMSTFPPRECGIATFTRDLASAIDKKFNPKLKSKILAMNNDVTNTYNYPEDAVLQINDTNIHEYINTAKKINRIDAIKVVNIQHEFGIFGGNYGDYLIPFLEILSKPVIITFHTVLPNPDERLKKVVQVIAEKVAEIIVMTPKAIEILKQDYGIDKDITIIPHGIPSVQLTPTIKEKIRLGYQDRIILSSFGMMNPGKGYEYVIDALPRVIERFPNVLYLIIGETHPVVRKKEGEGYRNFLEEKVKGLGLEKHVKFYNKYLTLVEIVRYLQATDVYISPSLNPDQIVSGTLSYAMGCGKPIISTPFLHAKDIVNHERGILVEFKNPESFANATTTILSNQDLKKKMEKNSYAYTRHMTWPNVALSYMKVFNKHTEEKRDEKKFPRIKLSHLIRLTDKFGVVQFADNTQPDRSSGYTLDDNTRALIVSCMYYDKLKKDSTLRLIRTYLNFIKYAQKDDGSIYNLIGEDKNINMEQWSDDAHGRGVWALGFLISLKSIPKEIREEAEEIFIKALKISNKITSPRAVSFMTIGLYFYNKEKPSRKNIFRIRRFADHLVSLYNQNKSKEWKWFEKFLTYSNSKLPESLFYAYLATKDKVYLDIAKPSLDFLLSITFENGIFAPIGHDGWYFQNGQKAHFDQQPIDTAAVVQTLILASSVTKNKDYLEKAISAFQWFLGKNSLNQIVYDESTGGCHDGIGEFSVNLNQGAESTISYLIARLTLLDLPDRNSL